MLCMPKLRVYVPAFDDDLRAQVDRLFEASHPAYLRLGLSELPTDVESPAYAPWRKLVDGDGWVVLVVGTLAGGIWQAVRGLDAKIRPCSGWSASCRSSRSPRRSWTTSPDRDGCWSSRSTSPRGGWAR